MMTRFFFAGGAGADGVCGEGGADTVALGGAGGLGAD